MSVASKGTGLRVCNDKTKYRFMSRAYNAGQSDKITTNNK